MTDATPARQHPGTSKAEVATTVQMTPETEVRGTVRIAPAVLIQLIETTVSDIDGVEQLVARKRRKSGDDNDQPQGKSFDDGKVRVIVDGDQISADIAITVQNGFNIERLTQTIRERVGVAAGRMLGMHVRNVDIYIDNIIGISS